MSDFEESFQDVIGYEGGYVNDPNDKGGETKYGIAKRWYPDIDIKNLTLEEAKQIYWKDYWNPLVLSLINDNDVATEIFEQGINLGKPWAAFHAQRTLQLLGKKDIVVDRWMGSATCNALNEQVKMAGRKQIILKALNGFQFKRYIEIITNDPTQQANFVGWLRRIEYT